MIDQAAAGLLMTIAETPGGKIVASVLNDFYPRQGKQLMQTNLLAPLGDTFAAPLDLDHGDEPLPLIWSGEHGCFGYYNPAAVWVTVPPERLTMFGVNMAVLLAHIVKDLDVSGGTGSKSLVDDVLWELGDAKIRNRRQRLPIWFARRLSDRDCWQKVEDLTKRRPHETIRVIVTSTPHQRLFSDALAGHLIVNLADVITGDFGLAIRPEILVARLDGAPVVDVNIGHEAVRLCLIEAQQQIHARPPKLRKCRPHLLHLKLSERDRLDRRHRDLGHPDAVWITIEQENVD